METGKIKMPTLGKRGPTKIISQEKNAASLRSAHTFPLRSHAAGRGRMQPMASAGLAGIQVTAGPGPKSSLFLRKISNNYDFLKDDLKI